MKDYQNAFNTHQDNWFTIRYGFSVCSISVLNITNKFEILKYKHGFKDLLLLNLRPCNYDKYVSIEYYPYNNNNQITA